MSASSSAKLILLAGREEDQLHSMERYLLAIKTATEALEIQSIIMRPPAVLPSFLIPRRLKKWAAFFEKFVLFPQWLRRNLPKSVSAPAAVHILDQGNSLYLDGLCQFRTLVTCHDLIAIRAAVGLGTVARPSRVQRRILAALKRADSWIFVSQHTKSTALPLLGEHAADAAVVHNPLFPTRDSAQPQNNRSAAQPPFLLHVGNSAWYKNRTGLLRIYSELCRLTPDAPVLRLLGQELLPSESSLITSLHLDNRIICHPNPSDEEIILAYQSARALIFPSLEEGFGWPPLEAMASGCPVFSSNRGPLVEVGGAAVEYFDPENPAQAAALIASRLGEGAAWREERIKLGLEQSARFSMRKFVAEMEPVYRKLLAPTSAY